MSVRASGKSAAQEQFDDNEKKAENQEFDTSRKFRTPGFHRMKTEWPNEDRIILDRARTMAERRLIHEFQDAYQVLNHLFDIVRTPVIENGREARDVHGLRIWAKDEYGNFLEDWDKLTSKERDHFLFTLTTRAFAWEQKAQDAWMESMLARAQWEERWGIDFREPAVGTIEDRDAYAKMHSIDERYFAIIQASYSRRADALVRSMERIAFRLQK